MTTKRKQHRSRAARRVKAIIRTFKSQYDADNFVRDMLTDLRHYCDTQKMDFADEDGFAYRNYMAEVGEDRSKADRTKTV